MCSRFPHSFFTPSGVGDRLLRQADSAEIKLKRWPTQLADEPPESVIEFSIEGSLPLTNDGALELLAGLVHEFRRPCQPRQEGGAE
jgi:hypothetical protein